MRCSAPWAALRLASALGAVVVFSGWASAAVREVVRTGEIVEVTQEFRLTAPSRSVTVLEDRWAEPTAEFVRGLELRRRVVEPVPWWAGKGVLPTTAWRVRWGQPCGVVHQYFFRISADLGGTEWRRSDLHVESVRRLARSVARPRGGSGRVRWGGSEKDRAGQWPIPWRTRPAPTSRSSGPRPDTDSNRRGAAPRRPPGRGRETALPRSSL